MNLRLLRFSSRNESTLGLLFNTTCGVVTWLCFTIEDEYRTKKVYGQTRIPSGTYNIVFKTTGKHHKKYKQKYPTLHEGMLLLEDVPNFTDILIHTGNTSQDTAGCLLIANTAYENITEKGKIGSSVVAYKRVYSEIADLLSNGEKVTIKIVDYDTIVM